MKPSLPRGFPDRRGAILEREAALIEAVRPVFEAQGFERIETPAIEYAAAIGAFLPDQDRPNAGVFSFQDDDEAWLALRYDLTAPLARFVAQHFDALPKPFRSWRSGTVFRNEKPGPGRFREFVQLDADTVGAPAPLADAEMAVLFAEALEAAGFGAGKAVIRINHRGALDAALHAAGVGEEDERTRLTALRALDKLDRLGAQGVRLLLGPGREDESGDFTKGAGLSAAGIDVLMSFVEAASAEDRLAAMGSVIGAQHPALAALSEMAAIAHTLGFGPDRVSIDPSVVRGLEYYTGPVFEAELTIETVDEQGSIRSFGSVGGGGRYDGLVGRFRKDAVPATGFSIGVSRLAAATAHLDKTAAVRPGPVVVLTLEAERRAEALALAAELRRAGLPAEAYVGAAGMRAQMKYADKRGASAVVIEGEDERAAGTLTVKDLALGRELAHDISDRETWRSERPAQQSVARGAIVPTLKTILKASA